MAPHLPPGAHSETGTSFDRWSAARTAAVSGCILVAAWPQFSMVVLRRQPSYPAVTLVLAVTVGTVAAAWDRMRVPSGVAPATAAPKAMPLAVAIAAAIVIAYAAARWVAEMLWNPVHGDMLIVIREATRRLLRGRNPYATYRTYDAPWDMVLPYGPALWGPFLLPQLLRVDLRIITIAGELFVPVWCGITATVEAAREHLLSSAAWILALAAIVASLELSEFTVLGHTPVYWPLIPFFSVAVTGRRWRLAAVLLGLLVLARSTMVVLVPVFGISVWKSDRDRAKSALGLLALTVAAGLLPFVAWDAHAVWGGMVASYPRLMKGFVWTIGDGRATNTIGVTGWLLAHHRESLVEATSAVALLAVYVLAWRALGRGARGLPWMAMALFAFSATSLWPVLYIYFDVLLLLVSAAMAETLGSSRIAPRALPTLASLAGIVFIVSAALRLLASPHPELTMESHRALPQGFSGLERERQFEFRWIADRRAVVLLPRSSAAPAEIRIVCRPVDSPDGRPQRVTAVLNGTSLGTAAMTRDWQTLRFRAPAPAWWTGFNQLELLFSFTVSPHDIGVGDDTRTLAAAVHGIEVARSSE